MVRERKDHVMAWDIIKEARTRWNATKRVDHEGDAQLIVDGALLEESEDQAIAIGELVDAIAELVTALADRRTGGISIHIGARPIVGAIVTMGGLLGGGAWAFTPVI